MFLLIRVHGCEIPVVYVSYFEGRAGGGSISTNTAVPQLKILLLPLIASALVGST